MHKKQILLTVQFRSFLWNIWQNSVNLLRFLQQARDDKKDKALTDAGIKIIRWREIPDAETIKTALQGLI